MGRTSRAAVTMRGRAYCHAPPFLGSSWHQTTSALGYFLISSCRRAPAVVCKTRRDHKQTAISHLHQVEGEGGDLLDA